MRNRFSLGCPFCLCHIQQSCLNNLTQLCGIVQLILQEISPFILKNQNFTLFQLRKITTTRHFELDSNELMTIVDNNLSIVYVR
jgi:hypothetical protein